MRTRIDFIASFFAKNEIDEIWLTFSDPQPKKPRKRLSSRLFIERYMQFLKPGGRLVYATCSLEPEEDENVVDWFAENHDCSIVPPKIRDIRIKGSTKTFLKIWPQYYNTEGFFVAVFRKD